MKYYLKLLRPRDWAKIFSYLFHRFLPAISLFCRESRNGGGFIAFCCFASAIYIINDYRDIEDDRKHPVKCNRPLASGKVNKSIAIVICIILLLIGIVLGFTADRSFKFLFILGIYFLINLAYSFGLKNIAIIDILILSAGFVLRVKAGSAISRVDTTEWLVIMTFLLSLFMAIAKRRDDLLLKGSTGLEMRKSMSGYNLDFLNTMLGLSSAIIIVAYINYTVSPVTIFRLGTSRLYYTSLFVIAGLMRYLQITFVLKKSGSPTEILYKDLFIQLTLALWVVSIYVILYLRYITFFGK